MLKRLLNEAKIKFILDTPGPIAVKGGGEELVVTQYKGSQTFYLPGTSLRGVIRSYAEKLTRSLAPRDDCCCDPLSKMTSCSEQLQRAKKDLTGEQVHAFCCSICRLFGSLAASSRIQVHDCLAVSGRDSRRYNVAIERESGKAAAGRLFDYPVWLDGRFEGEIVLRNFELWHLGLLGVVLWDLREGIVKVGFGKSKGLGAVTPTIQELALSYIGSFNNAGEIVNYRGKWLALSVATAVRSCSTALARLWARMASPISSWVTTTIGRIACQRGSTWMTLLPRRQPRPSPSGGPYGSRNRTNCRCSLPNSPPFGLTTSSRISSAKNLNCRRSRRSEG